MRPLFVLALLLLAVCAVAGCQSLADFLAAAKPMIDAVAPAVADVVVNSLSMQIADAVNQAAAGKPMGPDEIRILSETLSGGFQGAVEGALRSHADGQGAWNSFMSGIAGGVSGGGVAGATSWAAIRKAKAG